MERAARTLAGARSAAEILEARDRAGLAYDAAKATARLIKIRGAHDTLLTAAHHVQADALEIEAGAKRAGSPTSTTPRKSGAKSRSPANLILLGRKN